MPEPNSIEECREGSGINLGTAGRRPSAQDQPDEENCHEYEEQRRAQLDERKGQRSNHPAQKIDGDNSKGRADAGRNVRLKQHGSHGERKDDRRREGIVGQAERNGTEQDSRIGKSPAAGLSVAGPRAARFGRIVSRQDRVSQP